MKKTTRRALFLSFAAMFLCFTMLLGTTYAWFTDSVESDVNKIVAGNLDVELYNGSEKITGEATDPKFFDDVTNGKWEPGAMAWETFTVKNVGDLALKYQLEFLLKEDGADASLADVLKIAVIDGELATTTRIDTSDEKYDWKPLADYSFSGTLDLSSEEAKSDVRTFILWWEPSDKDNNYNMNNDNKGKQATVSFYLNLFATQLEAESDSFGTDYDAGAPWTGAVSTDWYFDAPNGTTEYTINSAEDLAGLAALINGTAESPVTTLSTDADNLAHDDFSGKTIMLEGDINLKDIAWTPIGRIGKSSTDFTYAFKGTFDGQGHTIYELNVSNEGWAGVFGLAHSAEIKNLNVVGATIESSRMAGAIVGQIYGSVNNCHVADANITVVPNAVGDGFDNGDKVGGIVGWLGDNGDNRTLTGCSAQDVEITAYRDVAGIAGYVASSTKVENNSVATISITVDQTTNYYGDKDFNAGFVFGRTGGAIVEGSNNVDAGVADDKKSSIETNYMANGAQLVGDPTTNEVALYLVPAEAEYTDGKFEVPTGVTTIGGYAFAYNASIEEIVLPTTVTTLNDRAFRDTSASKVVLNEGLENISYQAFRNASNVKEVIIPSTVTTISKEAFQNSGVTTLTIPANVTTIEYGGLRDMKMLETVVIEGNVDIPVYAFRACTNLKTVIIKGEDVTFGGGSRGMIFTNKENGDGSAITVYVANETVKERLLASDTAAKDYGGYKIVVGLPSVIEYDKSVDLFDALKSLKFGDTFVIPSGTYITTGTLAVPAGVTIVGADDGSTIIHQNSNAQDDILNCEGDVVIKNITFESNRKGYAIAGSTKEHDTNGNITVIGCTFKGIASEKNWGVYKNLNGNLVIENCKFDNYNNAICGVNNGNGSTTTITGCTFTNINGEAIGYVSSTLPADFEEKAIANNTGLTAENVIGY